MPAFKQTPASMRYLKARLSILKRPTFWAAASGLILSIFLVGEYLSNPQQYTGGNDPEAATIPPNQNPLGTLPTQDTPASNSEIYETLPELSNVPTQTSSDPQAAEGDRSPLLQEFLLGRSAARVKPERSSQPSLFYSPSTSGTRRDRPAETKVPSLYPPASSPSPSGFPGSSLSSPTDALRPASTSPNPLQSALDRYSPAASRPQASPNRSFSSSDTFGNSSLASPDPANPSATQDSLAPQDTAPRALPSSQFSSPQFSNPPYTPQLSPSPGTTGYTLPPSLRTSTPAPASSSNFQPVPGQITPQVAPAVPGQDSPPSSSTGQAVYPESLPLPTPAAQPVPSSYSVPREVPGRSIGGGRINTFSNP
jgi:hypothetical protein